MVSPSIAAQALDRVADDVAGVLPDGVHPEAARGSRRRRPGRRPRRSATCRPRTSSGCRRSGSRPCSTLAIMCPPPMNGGIAVEQLAAAVEDADPGRAVGLVRGPGVEVGAERADVDRHVRDGLRPVDEHGGAGRVAALDELGDRVDRAEHVRDVREGEQLRPAREQRGELLLDRAGPRRRCRRRPARAPVRSASMCHGTRFEWCSISVMTSRSPARDVGGAPRVGDEVDRLGRVAGEDRAPRASSRRRRRP